MVKPRIVNDPADERAQPYEPHSKETIADKLAPKGKPKVNKPGGNGELKGPDMSKVNQAEHPSELYRERYQLVDHGFKSIYDRVVRPDMTIKDDHGVDYRFVAITGDSNTGFSLTVRLPLVHREQTRPIKDFPGYGVQGNPLHPYTFEARVLPAITEYRQVKASGLGVDRVTRMLMDAVTFLADERVATLEAHEAFKAEMRAKLDEVERLIKESRDAR